VLLGIRLQLHPKTSDSATLVQTSTDSAQVLYFTWKFFFVLSVGFLWVMSQWGDVFAFLAKFTWPWAPTQLVIFWLKLFLETRLSSESLKSLGPNYGSKTQFLTKIKKFHEKYNLPSQDQLWSAITRQQIELESCSNPLKSRGSQPFYDLVPLGHPVLWTRATSSRTTNLIES